MAENSVAASNILSFENAKIMFRNFAGREGQYNREGDRNFVLFLEDRQLAEQMANNGWNVKYTKQREDGDEPQPYVQVAVSYNKKSRPPRVKLITQKGDRMFQNELPEEMVDMLDIIDIAHVDLSINGSSWAVNGKSGVKAYLRAIYVTMVQDDLERKYSDVPELEGSQSILEQKATVLQLEAGQDPNIIDAEIVEDDDTPF